MNRKLPVSVSLAMTIIAITVTFSITWLVSMNRFNVTVGSVTQLQAQYTKLSEIDKYVRGSFYGEINDDYLFDRIAAGYINGLADRYSAYYTAAEYAEMTDIDNGVLLGVGLELIRMADGTFRIVRVYEDSPAARAGVEQGGVILSVNGVDSATFASVRAVHSALRGEEGTELSLVCRYGVTTEETYNVRRIVYKPPTVETTYVNDYAYVRISSFTAGTAEEFDYAVRTARSRGVQGFVFDLRANAGGRFMHAYDMIDLLCPLGAIAKSRNLAGEVSVRATSDEAAVDLPMAVLVNGGTSAAAELFAAVLRELAGGQIVGTRTAGRGMFVSQPFMLADGSAVVVTEALLLTGSDETFNDVGLTPDVEVSGETVSEEMLLSEPNFTTDLQLVRALEVLRAMVRERGGEAGGAAINAPPQGSSSQAPPSSSQVPPPDSSASGAAGGDSGQE